MTDLVALARRLAAELERREIPYAIGGALALGFHAPPRGTQDIDLNLFLDASVARPGLEALVFAGVELDLDLALKRCADRGDCMGRIADVRVDVFVNSIPLHEHAAERLVRVELDRQPLWILSAEDLVVLKLLFYRPKDLDDCRRVLALQGSSFDAQYARDQLVLHVGSGDLRVHELDRMLQTFLPGEGA